jgi:hypothetical protein
MKIQRAYILLSLLSATITFAQEHSQRLELGSSWFPIRETGFAYWEPTYSIRAAYLYDVLPSMVLAGAVEYTAHRYSSNDPMSNILYTNGQRRDFGFSPSLRILNIVEIGAGIFYSSRATVYNRNFSGGTSLFTSAESGFHVSFRAGLLHAFSVYQGWQISIGLLLHQQDYRSEMRPAFQGGIACPM